MNDRQRLTALTTVTRLSNWFQRTRLDPAEFVSRNRATIDELLAKIERPPPPAPQQHRQPNQWRRWSELSSGERARLAEWLSRRKHEDWIDELAKKHIRATPDELTEAGVHRPRRQRFYGGFAYDRSDRSNFFRTINLHFLEGTPADRLQSIRAGRLRKIADYPITSTFLPDLHPDDVELTADNHRLHIHITCDRAFKEFAALFHCPGLREDPLAISLILTDEPTRTEVYYCALFAYHRKEPPTLERAYVARVWNISGSVWRITGRYKTAGGALKGGLQLYSHYVAQRIQPKEAAE